MSEEHFESTSRREFGKAVVAAGGASALAACLGRTDDRDVPRGVEDPAELPAGQHRWALHTDEHGNDENARHHVLRCLDYGGDGVPSGADRQTVEDALRALERAYEWSSDGLLFSLGYSPTYFERFGASPTGVDLPAPEPLAPFEDPAFDEYDAMLHLASDDESVVLEAEEAMFGERETANGVAVEERLSQVFTAGIEYPERRTGFVGAGLPAKRAADADNVPAAEVPENAPLFMGFKSGFDANQASDDRVTISEGPFAGGTTQHVSALDLNLRPWWLQDDRWQRVAKMFAPTHAEEGLVEGVGANMGTESRMDEATEPRAAAETFGVVGHSQKMLSVREDDEPVIQRRDFDSTDEGTAGLHFLAIQETIDDFERTRRAMNGTDVAAETSVGERLNNGILQYLTTQRRGNWLLPPRDRRALPRPDA